MLLSYKSYNRQQNHKYDGFILQTSSHLNQFFVLALSSDSSSPTWGTARCVGLTMVTIGGSGAPRIHLQWFFGVVFVICKIQDASYQITSSIFLCCIIIYIVYIYIYILQLPRRKTQVCPHLHFADKNIFMYRRTIKTMLKHLKKRGEKTFLPLCLSPNFMHLFLMSHWSIQMFDPSDQLQFQI